MVGKIVVIGDVMLDAYNYAKTRENPEEDALCTTTKKIAYRLGGAGNVAVNLAKLGSDVFFISRVGDDREGEFVKMLLDGLKIKNKLIIDEHITTTLKERTLSNKDGHYHHRADREGVRETRVIHNDGSITDYFGGIQEMSCRKMDQYMNSILDSPIIVVSDYAKGMMTQELAEMLKKTNARLLVDTKPQNKYFYEKVWLIKPNSKEAREMTGIDDDLKAAKELRKKLECRVLLTRGEEGMHYLGFENEKWSRLNIDSHAKPGEVKDRVGAGDNVIATFAYSLNEGYDVRKAMILANKAAGIAVGHRGCYAPSLKELGLDKS